MQLRIIPLNVVKEKVYTQLFPPDGDYVTWIRANNPDYPEFEACNVKLHLFHSDENEFLSRSVIISEMHESIIREHFRGKDGFGDYSIVYLEVNMELLLLYAVKEVSIVREPRGQSNPAIHFSTELDEDPFIKDWIDAGMPEPWEERNLQRKA